MPEIKHQFTGGKMNKDVNERLVPKGEYRDAMNIQVSTSEQSDVGTVQNILGNVEGCNYDFFLQEPSSFVVGSVADEKNDSLYWLVSGQPYGFENAASFIDDWTQFNSLTDRIVRKTPSGCDHVFVDSYAFTVPNSQFTSTNSLNELPTTITTQVQPGWTVAGIDDAGNISNVVNVSGVSSGPSYQAEPSQQFLGGYFLMKMLPGLAIPGGPATYGGAFTDVLYVGDYNTIYNTPAVAAGLSGNTIELFTPSDPNYQTNEILSASVVNITLANGIGFSVLKLNLVNNITPFVPNSDSDWDYNPMANGEAIANFYQGERITGSMTLTGAGYTVSVPSNTVVCDILNFDVLTLSVGDAISLPYSNGCVESINLADNSFTVTDCSTGALTPVPTSPFLFTLPEQTTVNLEDTLNLSISFTSLVFSKPRVLNFNHDEYITGINIVDDMLFWTDGKTEPKKINIPRSISGTHPDGDMHTRLINFDQNIVYNSNILTEEKHVTVIRKGPKTAPTINSITSFREGNTFGYFQSTNAFSPDGIVPAAIGSTTWIAIDDLFNSGMSFEVGDILRFSSNDQELAPEYFEIRATVLAVEDGPYTTTGFNATANQTAVRIEIESMSEVGLVNAINPSITDWNVGLEEVGKFLFEQKLPRFSTRYKYADGEYSTIGPFSEVVFIPGNFRYHPSEAYNTGMVNKLRELTIQDFIPNNIPKDVVQVDLLYKNEMSPNIYTIESISRNDSLIDGTNPWNSQGSKPGLYGSYKVSSENIYATLSSNQLLRSWDNVPRSAVAQEITGNRIVYGNYLQNYNLVDSDGKKIKPNITTTIGFRSEEDDSNRGKKSIKSMRAYDVGIVWGDKYGRETPIITPSSGATLVPKSKAKRASSLNVEVSDKHPDWADYYKVFIKETSNEYYNLAMDRMFDAEDGNVWISFPSIDRNKVDEDTYIILKKGIDTEEPVIEEARYKIVAIENEAPDFIKTRYDLLTESVDDAGAVVHSSELYGGNDPTALSTLGNSGLPDGGKNAPIPGVKGFSIDKNRWTADWFAGNPSANIPSNMGLPRLDVLFADLKAGAEEMWVEFTRADDDLSTNPVFGASKRYRVTQILLDDDDQDYDNSTHYEIKIHNPIFIEDSFITEDLNEGNDHVKVHFWKKVKENTSEFDGRFFVKILKDEVVSNELVNYQTTVSNWTITSSTQFYRIKDSSLTHDDPDSYYKLYQPLSSFPTSYPNSGTAPPINNASSTKSQSQWKDLLKFGGTTLQGNWFIDEASFASHMPGVSINVWNADTTIQQGVATISTSDTTSTQTYTFQGYTNTGNSCGFANIETNSYNVGNGISTGVMGMKGVFSVGTSNYFDFSYSMISPSTTGQNTNFTVGEDDGNNPTNSSTDQEESIVNRLAPNNRFKIEGDPTIYRIHSVTKRRLFNNRGYRTAPAAYPSTCDIPCPTYDPGCSDCGDFYQPCCDCLGTPVQTVPGNYSTLNRHLEEVVMGVNWNRRKTYRIKYTVDELSLPDPDLTVTQNGWSETLPDNPAFTDVLASGVDGVNNSVTATIQFVDQYDSDLPNVISNNPAIFETEPKEDVDLDIYYEATNNIPIKLTTSNREQFIPIGATIEFDTSVTSTVSIPEGIFVTGWQGDDTINISTPLTTTQFSLLASQYTEIKFVKDDGSWSSANIISGAMDPITGMVISLEISISRKIGLGWFNCWSFNNGVESNRIGDTYNKPYITNGVKVSSVIIGDYEEEKRINGLIYSGIYNSNSNTNELNQFITAEKITKDINPIYGSVQKLHSRSTADGDLIALCEDRVLKILANKDAVFNADGNPQLTATENVLGQTLPYAGEYGISKNPESFASESYRVYFTDKVRGTVMRLSKDGLTPISMHGMKDWFRDNLKLSNKLIGSYDDRKDEYNITLKGDTISKTVSFKEDVRGWVSFKSFVPEYGMSCANEYYTFLNGKVWKHHDNGVDRNTFYGTNPEHYTESSVEIIFNEVPGSVKSFKTINYEGSQAKVTAPLNDSSILINDNQYFNLTDVEGWYVNSFYTNLENGGITEFIEKEGKWFGHTIGNDVTMNSMTGAVTGNYDTSDFSIQGVGRVSSVETSVVWGCTDPTAFNYNSAVTNDDGSCIPITLGCTDPTADNYNANVNTDDGSCIWYGCTNPIGQINYNPQANIDDGSCIPAVAGCQVPGMFNYDSMGTSNVACGGPYLAPGDGPNGNNLPTPQPADYCCIPINLGCTDPNADNYILPIDQYTDVNTDDGSCVYEGCTDPLATNYSFPGSAVNGPAGYFVYLNGTAVDNGSCIIPGGCMDNDPSTNFGVACNYDPIAVVDNGSCVYCGDNIAINYDGADAGCTTNCIYCQPPTILQVLTQTTADPGLSNGEVIISWNEPILPGYGNLYHPDSYTITMYSGGVQIHQMTINENTTGNYPAVGWGSGTISWSWNGWPAGYFEITVQSNCTNSTTSSQVLTSGTMLTTPVLGCTDNTGDYTALGASGMPQTTSPNGTAIGMGTSYMWGACNFNPSATQDDGSCEYTSCVGCTDSGYVEYDPTAIVPNAFDAANLGWCASPILSGCTDSSAFNYDSAANADCAGVPGGSDGSCCTPYIYGCTDNTTNNNGSYATNFDANANSPCNASNDGTSAFDGGAGAGSNECCSPYNCPPWNVNLIGGYLYIMGEFANTTFNVSNPVTNSPSSGNFVGGNGYFVNETFVGIGGYKIQDSLNINNFFNPGDTTVDVTLTIGTGPDCMFGPTTYTYTVGCTDPSANNVGNFDVTDNTQCIYSGCMDATLQVDGSGYAAGNYDPNAAVPCTTNCVGTPYGISGDNCCCEYPGSPTVQVSTISQTIGTTTYDAVTIKVLHNNGAYNSVEAADIELGGTVLNVDPGSANTNMENDPAAYTGQYEFTQIGNSALAANNETIGTFDWDDYTQVDANGDEFLSVYVLLDFNGTVNNSSLPTANALPSTDASAQTTFSVGCKYKELGNVDYVNWDASLDLHKPNSCIENIPGCTDSSAVNYLVSYTTDCAGALGGNDYSCCCYGCNTPTWQNPFLDNIVIDTSLTPTVATQVDLHFNPVSSGILYRLYFKRDDNVLGSVWITHDITDATALQTGDYTFSPGTTTQTPDGGFNKETRYAFYLEANCDNCASWSGPSNTLTHYFTF